MDDQNKSQIPNPKSQDGNGQTLVEFPKAGVVQDQSQQQNTQSYDASQNGQVSQAPQQQPQVFPQQQSTPPVKEQEPLPSITSSEFAAPSEKSMELEPEVEEAGIKETVNEPKLTIEDKIAGIEKSMESIPVDTKPVQKIKYPLALEEAEKTVKGPLIFKNTGNAMLWLAMLILRQFKMKEKEASNK